VPRLLSLFAHLLVILLLTATAGARLRLPGGGPQRQVQYLSGRDNIHTAARDFYYIGGRTNGYWATIQEPFCWEQQGLGAYNYGRAYETYGKIFALPTSRASTGTAFRHRPTSSNVTSILCLKGP